MKRLYIIMIFLLSLIVGDSLNSINNQGQNNSEISEKDLKSMACRATWRSGLLPLEEIPWRYLTHLYYSFALPRSDGSLDTSHLKETDALVAAGHAHGVKIILSVGGGSGSKPFTDIAVDDIKRRRFVDELLNYIDSHNIDGMDLDWEYWPEDGTINTAWSDAHLTLARELKAGLEPDGKILSISVFAGDWYGKNLKTELIEVADWFLVMAFDNAGSWSVEQHHSTFDLVKQALDYWEGRIGPGKRSKLVVTVPFYGRGFPKGYRKGDPTTNLPYCDILENFKRAHKHDVYRSEYETMYYNGRKTIRKKAEYIKDNGYAGIIAWELCMDSKDPKKALMPVIADVLK